MLNQYPLWKYIMIAVIIAIGAIYAAPNLYGTDPALQIAVKNNKVITASTRQQVIAALDGAKIPYRKVVLDDRGLLVRFSGVDEQLNARDKLKEILGQDYTIAQNLAPAAPAWFEGINARPMYLGLDLRGGLHFLIDVDMGSVIKSNQERFHDEIRQLMRKINVRTQLPKKLGDGIAFEMSYTSEQDRDKAVSAMRREFPNFLFSSKTDGGNYIVTLSMQETAVLELKKLAVQQNITTLRARVNELGVAEPVIQQQGERRIVVQLPGIQDSALAKRILSATATLEFRLADPDRRGALAASTGQIPPGYRLYKMRNGSPVLLKDRVIITGDRITHANSGFDPDSGSPMVKVQLDGIGAKSMLITTKNNVKKPMAVVFIESKSDVKIVDGKEKVTPYRVEEVINVATIQGIFSNSFQITGLDSPKEAQTLALLLRAGALSAPIRIVEERTIGPSAGKDNIKQGMRSVTVGMALVIAFMVFWYRGFGLVANAALLANLVLIVAVLSMLQATLTLPGIAGIILTVGMAVDANVLIFERIREELRIGNTPQSSINAGYEKALSTIADANITTFIAALVLYMFGTGPIRGFAITLSIGIVTSMFTAIMGTRAIVNLFVGGRRIKTLSI
ncbi:MAG: protein translocase subunit SecD [Gammaproteobacteria bacterium]|nr:protein translocase subunit SecD [Gammaproteobacteria bacterium]MDH5650846.1 protein translocase subunit SecD [Gammaproteobacteria bacterium]